MSLFGYPLLANETRVLSPWIASLHAEPMP